jgi:hypothetical protein
MSKLPYFACAACLLLLGAKPQNEMFAKFNSVEAYEIRPGMLAMPKYAEDGQVCEIDVEKRNILPNLARIGDSFSREEIYQIIADLVPPNERGPKTPFYGNITGSGQSWFESYSYENVEITAYGDGRDKCNLGTVGLRFQWTKRKCQ